VGEGGGVLPWWETEEGCCHRGRGALNMGGGRRGAAMVGE